jgi:D-alanyl-D-alanine carboxypeptidase/D-alanyl-D-alanine-endopeptidase (penicillin-binding protein 4)
MRQDSSSNAFLPKLLWLTAFLCAAIPSHAQNSLPESVSAALRAARIAETSISALVLPIRGGAPRLAYSEERPMAPASTLKLVTTLVALEELGPVFRWRTELLTRGSSDDMSLRGTLYLRGGGDPNLNWDGLRAMFRTLRAQGIRRLDANLVLDRAYFQPMRPDLGAPVFDESPDAYYNVIPDALLLNGNMIEFSIESNDQQTSVQSRPALDRVRIDANLSLNDTPCETWDDDWDRPQTRIKPNGTVTLVLRGAFPRNCKTKTRLSLLDRNLYIERFLRAFWKELGGSWRGKVVDGTTPPDARLLVERNSDTLADSVRPINKSSDNAMARTLYLTLGTQLPKEGRSENTFRNAEAAVRNWFVKNGISVDGLVLENGSGLSRLERISPRQLAGLLQVGASSNWFAEFASSLPIVAIDGAMRKRLRQSAAAARARIKTGTLKDAVAVAGYVRDVNNLDWTVVAFINDPEAKKGRPALDALIDWVASGVDAR